MFHDERRTFHVERHTFHVERRIFHDVKRKLHGAATTVSPRCNENGKPGKATLPQGAVCCGKDYITCWFTSETSIFSYFLSRMIMERGCIRNDCCSPILTWKK